MSDVMYALLALDSYHRGYDLQLDIAARSGPLLGNAVLITEYARPVDSFYAAAYSYNGKIVISYRGTDDTSVSLQSDIATGWSGGGGFIDQATQLKHAAQFYTNLTGKSLWDGPADNVVLTGHSLGGGLAGFVGAVTSTEAVLFDHMPFGGAAYASWVEEAGHRAGNNELPPDFPDLSHIRAHYTEGEALTVLRDGTVFGTINTLLGAYNWATDNVDAILDLHPLSNIREAIENAIIEHGNTLEGMTAHFEGQLNSGSGNAMLSNYGTSDLLAPIQLHSQALLSILLYAEENGITEWEPAAVEFLGALFDNEISETIHIPEGFEHERGPADKMMAMIAYSLVDGAIKPFGDTAARALLNDGEELGRIKVASQFGDSNPFLDNDAVFVSIGRIIAQNAGYLAKNAILSETDADAIDGILSISEDFRRVTIDMTEETWTYDGVNGVDGPFEGAGDDIIGRVELLDELNETGVRGDVSLDGDFWTGLHEIWNVTSEDLDLIDKVTVARDTFTHVVDLEARPELLEGSNRRAEVFVSGDASDLINSSLEDDSIIFGRGGDDILVGRAGRNYLAGGDGEDRLIGGDETDFISGGGENENPAETDVADYSGEITGERAEYGMILSFGDYDETNNLLMVEDDGFANRDYLTNVEEVIGTHLGDEVYWGASTGLEDLEELGRFRFDGHDAEGDAPDFLSFADAQDAVYLGTPGYGLFNFDDDQAVELYDSFSPFQRDAILAWNMIVPTEEPDRDQGLSGPTGIQFRDFEHIVGSTKDDVLGLHRLNPGGVLSDSEEATFQAARTIKVEFDDNTPQQIGDITNNRTAVAATINQNQIEVTVEGGAGNDIIVGPRTGHSKLYGGDGVDKLYAGGFTSEIHGGAGTDFVQGGGFGSHLYGGDGRDIFGLSHHSFAMDAEDTDFAVWGSFHLTGGVKQWWMEDNWAYWTPISSVVSAGGSAGLSGGAVLNALSIVLDANTLGTVRYSLTNTDQLVVQFARGRGGQAVIENYELDTETGVATAGITVFEQKLGEPGTISLTQYRDLVQLAIQAGFGTKPFGTDPLAFDLDGDGLELTGRAASQVFFDVDGDGFAEHTGWVRPDDGLLAHDLNGDGQINDVTELFGDDQEGGFDQLSRHDDNADGVIDATDAVFDELTIWRDLNTDGRTDSGELTTLTEEGIAEISLASTEGGAFVRGTQITRTGTFTRDDGSTGQVADLTFDPDQMVTRYLGDGTVSTEAGALPELRGFGEMPNLRVAMTSDAALLSLVEDMAAQDTGAGWGDIVTSTEQVLFRWSGADALSPVPIGDAGFDGRKLAFLEKFLGQTLTPRNTDGMPSDRNADELTETFDSIVTNATIRLAVQGPWDSLFTDVAFNAEADKFIAADASTIATTYAAVLQQLPADAAAAETAWQDGWAPAMAAFTDALIRHDGNNVRQDYAAAQMLSAAESTASPVAIDALMSGIGVEGRVLGTAGDDTLSRDETGVLKVYLGGEGDDEMSGGRGQDVYVLGANFGQDTIMEIEGAGVEMGDRIRFSEHGSDEISITRDGVDMILIVDATGDSVRVVDQFLKPSVLGDGTQITPNTAIEDIQFADGTIMQSGEIAALVGMGTDASETLSGTGTVDELTGLKGDDLLLGGDDGDVYFYAKGDGHDTIHDVMTDPLLSAADSLVLSGGITIEDFRLTRDGASDDLVIEFETPGDEITIVDQFAYGSVGYTSAFALDSRIEGVYMFDGGSTDWFDMQARVIGNYTTGGDDSTYGYGTPDNFMASGGADYLSGFDGGDTYHWRAGAGNDTIEDASRFIDAPFADYLGFTFEADDVLRFGEGITAADVEFSRPGPEDNLVITLTPTGETLTILGQFDGQPADLFGILGDIWFDRIERFEFEDGTVLTERDVLDIITTGTAGDDALYGALDADTLDGGAGDDLLSGENGNDVYVFGPGYGHDRIEEGADNILAGQIDKVNFLPGITFAQTQFALNADRELVISFDGLTDTLTIAGQFDFHDTGPFGVVNFSQIETLEYADGHIVAAGEIRERLMAEAGTDADDVIEGFYFDDVIDGGAGNDQLSGGDGADTYVWGRGYGDDEITEQRASIFSDALDKVAFTAGLSADDVVFERPDGNFSDLVIRITNTGETLTIRDMFAASLVAEGLQVVEEFHFSDGTVLNVDDVKAQYLANIQTDGDNTVMGFETEDIIDGGAGNDLLQGWDRADTYLFGFGSGHDIVDDKATAPTWAGGDTVRFGAGVTEADITLDRQGGDLVITLTGGADSLTVTDSFNGLIFAGVESFVFENGTVWSLTDITAQLATGSPDAETVEGSDATDDILDGGAGDDLLIGHGGADTYVFEPGHGWETIDEQAVNFSTLGAGDALAFGAGITPADVAVIRDGDDLRFSVGDGTEGVTVLGQFAPGFDRIETVTFQDGTAWTDADLRTRLIAEAATEGDDLIEGYIDSADDLDGGAGNDLLIGHEGNDIYRFGIDSGADTIEDQTLNIGGGYTGDRVVFGAGVTPDGVAWSRDGGDLLATLVPSGDTLRIVDQFTFAFQRVDLFEFEDGTALDHATVAATMLASAATQGDDTIEGSSDQDDQLAGGAGDDLLIGHEGNDSYYWRPGDGNDVIDEQVLNIGLPNANDRLILGQGITPDSIALARSGAHLTITNTETDETLTVRNQFGGSPLRIDQIEFADGAIWSAEELQLEMIARSSTDGADVVEGFSDRDDDLNGGIGDDLLIGHEGIDTYRFDIGSGDDRIEEQVLNIGLPRDGDRVVFGEGIAPEDMTVARQGNDLVFSHANGTDSLTVAGQFGFFWLQLESFEFANGTVWAMTEVNDLLTAGAAPVLDDDTVATMTDTAVTIDPAMLLANDVDPEGATLSLVSVDNAVGGFVSVQADDTILFEPLPGFSGDATFRYSATDGGLTSSATVTVDVVPLPTVGGPTQSSGTSGDDTLIGTDADDNITARSGADQIFGGAGNDSINAGAGDDEVWGDDGDDLIVARSGNDMLQGGAGNDTIRGGGGGDVIVGGDGNDDLIGGAGNDDIRGEDGADTLRGGMGEDSLNGGYGDDLLSGGANDDHLSGEDGSDILNGGVGADVLVGGIGADTLRGGNGQDILRGGSGDDMLRGGRGDDHLTGDDGSDALLGGDGNDILHQAFSVTGDLDVMNGGGGVDIVDFSGFAAAIWADLDYAKPSGIEAWTRDGDTVTTGTWRGIAELESIENLIGSNHHDELYDDLGNNRIGGAYGDDKIGLSGGLDDVDGGDGNDTASFAEYQTAVWIDLDYTGSTSLEAWTRGGNNVDTGAWRAIANLENIENVVASSYSDRLVGDAGDNAFTYTGDGVNTGGFDKYFGESGSDTADFSETGSAVWVDLSYSGATGYEAWTRGGTDVDSGDWAAIADLSGIENVVGTMGSDMLFGDAGNNTFGYVGSEDGGGLDYFDGDTGSDTADFSMYQHAVWVDLDYTGSTGFEAWTRGGADVDSGTWKALANLTSIENVTGTIYSDKLTGDAGNNTFGYVGDGVDRGGLDEFNGEGGSDTADFSGANSAVWIDLDYTGSTGFEAWTRGGTDVNSGIWTAIANLTGIENLVGSEHNDQLRGDADNNILTGGAGADSFVFEDSFGNDTVTDFRAGSDVLNFVLNATVEGFADLSVSVVGDDTVVSTLDGSITLAGVTTGIDADDFVF